MEGWNEGKTNGLQFKLFNFKAEKFDESMTVSKQKHLDLILYIQL